jgi:hypothetical protein
MKHKTGRYLNNPVNYKPKSEVKTFSRQSRNKLLKTLLSIDYDAMGSPVFFTLTYPGKFSEDPLQWKKDFHAWVTRIKYNHPGLCLVWRLEPQKRGAPHYSGFLWGWDTLGTDEGRQELSRTWYEVVGSRDEKHLRAGTQAILLDGPDRRQKIYYLAKYQSKKTKGAKNEFFDYPVGRYWGVCGRSNLAISKETVDLPRREWMLVRRVLRKRLEKVTSKGKFKAVLNQQEVGLWSEMSDKEIYRLLNFFEDQEQKDCLNG